MTPKKECQWPEGVLHTTILWWFLSHLVQLTNIPSRIEGVGSSFTLGDKDSDISLIRNGIHGNKNRCSPWVKVTTMFSLASLWLGSVPIHDCRTIKIKAQYMYVMREFVPKRICQTHTGSWSLVNSCILMRWPDGLDIGRGLGQVQRLKRDSLTMTIAGKMKTTAVI